VIGCLLRRMHLGLLLQGLRRRLYLRLLLRRRLYLRLLLQRLLWRLSEPLWHLVSATSLLT
jgi:hypothetical protein